MNILNNQNKNNLNNPNFNPEKEIVKTVDMLFKKTVTKPVIYYLPLTEEEVNKIFNIRYKKKKRN